MAPRPPRFRAVGGAGLVFTEATATTAEGRISPEDLGIWQDAHVEMLARIVDFVRGQGSAAGIQLAHAGRKASTKRPWSGGGLITGGGRLAGRRASRRGLRCRLPVPRALDTAGIAAIVEAFRDAARRARAGRIRCRRGPCARTAI